MADSQPYLPILRAALLRNGWEPDITDQFLDWYSENRDRKDIREGIRRLALDVWSKRQYAEASIAFLLETFSREEIAGLN